MRIVKNAQAHFGQVDIAEIQFDARTATYRHSPL